MFYGPKKVKSPCCMYYVMRVDVGLKEKENNGGRKKQRETSSILTGRFEVCAQQGYFQCEEMGKSHAGTLQKTEKKNDML